MLKEKLENKRKKRHGKVLAVPPVEKNNLVCISASLPRAEPATDEKVPNQSRKLGVIFWAEDL